jgi:hypothetical protein
MSSFVSLVNKAVATRAGRSFEFVAGVPLELEDDAIIREDFQANGILVTADVDPAVLAAITGVPEKKAAK